MRLLEYTTPRSGPLAHLVFGCCGQQLHRIPAVTDLPSTTKCLVNLNQVGRNRTMGRRKQILLLLIGVESRNQGIEIDGPLLVLDGRNIHRKGHTTFSRTLAVCRTINDS